MANAQTIPIFFDSMTGDLSKNFTMNQGQQNIARELNARSVANFARKKFEDEIKKSKDYNKAVLRAHEMKVQRDFDEIDGEKIQKKNMMVNLGRDLRTQMQQHLKYKELDSRIDRNAQTSFTLPIEYQ